MSSLDLYEDGFPHSTREGYSKGCKSSAHCPGVLEHGYSCADANMRYSSDYGFRRLVDQGLTPDEIHDRMPPEPSKPKPKKPPVDHKTFPASTTRTAGEVNSATASVKPPAGQQSRSTPEGIEAGHPADDTAASPADDLGNHGTHTGYQKGCHAADAATCPSKLAGGISCIEARKLYLQDWRAKKAAEVAGEETVELEPAETEEAAPAPKPPTVEEWRATHKKLERLERVDDAVEAANAELNLALVERDSIIASLQEQNERQAATIAALEHSTAHVREELQGHSPAKLLHDAQQLNALCWRVALALGLANVDDDQVTADPDELIDQLIAEHRLRGATIDELRAAGDQMSAEISATHLEESFIADGQLWTDAIATPGQLELLIEPTEAGGIRLLLPASLIGGTR